MLALLALVALAQAPDTLGARPSFVFLPAANGGFASYSDGGFMLAGSYGESASVTRATVAHCQTTPSTMVALVSGAPCLSLDGLVVETASTNLVQNGRDLSLTPWTTYGNVVAAPTVVASDGGVEFQDPWGTFTASKVTWPATTSATHRTLVYQQPTTTAATHTVSLWARTGSGTATIPMMLNPTGTSVTGSTQMAATSSWQLFQASGAGRAGTSYFFIGPDRTYLAQGDTPITTLYLTGAKAELGTHATNYSANGADRAVVAVTVPTTAWPTSRGEVSLDFVPEWSSPTGWEAPLFNSNNNTTATDGLDLKVSYNSLPNQLIFTTYFAGNADSSTATFESGTLTWVPGQRYRIRARWGGGAGYVWRDEVLVASTPSGFTSPNSHHSVAYLGTKKTATAANGAISNLKVTSL